MKNAARIVWITITIIVAALYVISSLAVYFSPVTFSFLTIASLLYLPVLVLYSFVLIIWLFLKKRISVLLLVLFFTGYKSFVSTVALNFFSSSWKWEKENQSLRVMTWNVNFFGNPYIQNDSSNSLRRQMLRYISQVRPDVLCVQDLRVNESVGERIAFVNNTNDMLLAGGYRSYFYPFHFDYNGTNYCDKMGVAIFYRGDIVDTGSIKTMGHNKNERAGYADILVNGKRVR